MLAPTAVVGRVAYGWRNIQLDDAMIYLRYVRNFREGRGLTYNPGERFNGLTSPLFSYVMAAGSLVATNWQLLMIGVATVTFLAATIVFGKTFGRNNWESAFIAVALSSTSYFYATFGMETPMFLLMIAVTLYMCRIRSDYVLVAAAVLVGTRPEGVFLAAPALIDFFWHHRRLPRTVPIVLASVIFALPFVIGIVYYGHLLPATAGAKIGQGQSGFWGADDAFVRIGYLRAAFFSNSKTAVFLILALAIAGLIATGRDHVVRVASVFAASLAYFYWLLNLPNYHWYYAPFIALAVVFACKTIWRLGTPAVEGIRAGRWGLDSLAIVLPVAAVVFIGLQVVTLAGWGHHPTYEAAGAWIKQHSDPDDSVAAIEIGNIGWYSERPIVDVLGLVNEDNADFIADEDVYSWLTVYQPDLILRFTPPSPWETATNVLVERGAYVADQSFPHPGFELLRKTKKYSDAEIAAIVAEARLAAGVAPPA
jgi:arabinofuranosyltransferase